MRTSSMMPVNPRALCSWGSYRSHTDFAEECIYCHRISLLALSGISGLTEHDGRFLYAHLIHDACQPQGFMLMGLVQVQNGFRPVAHAPPQNDLAGGVRFLADCQGAVVEAGHGSCCACGHLGRAHLCCRNLAVAQKFLQPPIPKAELYTTSPVSLRKSTE